MTNRAFRSTRGLVGGLAILLVAVLSTIGLSGCGAPQYTYVSDSSAKAFYKVPHAWHQISGQIFVFFVMVVAAAEAAVGLAIIIAIFRTRQTLNVDQIDLMKL